MSYNNARRGFCGITVALGVMILFHVLHSPKPRVAAQHTTSALGMDICSPSLLSFLVTHDLFPDARSKSFDQDLYERLSEFALRDNGIADEHLVCIGMNIVAGIHGDSDAR